MAAEIEAARAGARAHRSRLDVLVHRHAVRDSHRAHEHRSARCSACSRPASRSLGDMLIAVLFTLLVINPLYLRVARTDALDRAAGVALAPAASRGPTA